MNNLVVMNGGAMVKPEAPDFEDATFTISQRYREGWLTKLSHLLRQRFADHGYAVPVNVRLSCGWPHDAGKRRKHRPAGECWDQGNSEGGIFEIFVSPHIVEAVDVAAIAAHEMVHATVGLAAKHGAPFRACATAIGLVGMMRATVPGERFKQWFAEQTAELGPYPHDKLDFMRHTGKKKQETRLLKVECEACKIEGNPYIVRMSRSTLDRGAPICPEHERSMIEA